MSKQDQIVDDDEPDTCPLCIEELDISDRNFRPCPCGYQICQFCYNHLKTQLNNCCPACRRPYDDKNIKFDAPSPEELAKFKENKAQQEKKRVAARKQEVAVRHADSLSRKHLAGIRVRRQNLVYVTGLRLNTSDPQLSEKLRGDQFFGQYGKIDKIVVNKPKDSRSLQPVGVYITYFEKEAAALCIEMVNGTQNAGGLVRADYGTTKYCSAFLRNEICSNKNCTFLHEVGDDNESFTREGLSSLNAISSQSPHAQAHSSAHSSAQQPQHQPPPLSLRGGQATPAPQAMERQDSNHETSSPVDSSDGSALPSTASWAREPLSRRPSQTQSFASGSPVVSNANPMPPVTESPMQEESPEADEEAQQPQTESKPKTKPLVDTFIQNLQKRLAADNFQFIFDDSGLSFQDKELVNNLPPLFDPCGGAKRLAARKREAERRQEKDQQGESQSFSGMEPDDNAAGGSLQLGGEPEERHDLDLNLSQQGVGPDGSLGMERGISPAAPGMNSRSPLPHQQQQYLAQQFKSNSPNLAVPGQRMQGDYYQGASGLSHTRQTSRFSFANDTAGVTTSIKPATNPKLMNQQSSMMPPANQYNPLSQQNQSGTQLFSSGVQGPPPGLKATGTPPVSGGGMFGQGHGFATAGLGYGVNSTSRNTNDEMMRELLRNRGSSAGSGQTPEGGRREYNLSSFSHQNPSPAPNPGLSSFPYGSHPGAFQDHGPQKQKKRGKKHRHANTSSSGGGVVDLADPSILQARMHQGGGAGQGQYGAQGQGQDSSFTTSGTNSALVNEAYFGGDDASLFAPFRNDTYRGSASTTFVQPALPIHPRRDRVSPRQLFGRGPTFSNDDASLMPGLGVLPPKHVESERMEPQQPAVSSMDRDSILQKVDVKPKPMPPPNEDASFPALPKATPVRPATEIKPKPKQSADVRAKKDVKKRESAGDKDTETSSEALNTSKAKQNGKERQHPGKLDIPATAVSSLVAEADVSVEAANAPAKSGTPSQAQPERSATPSTNSRPATPNQPADTPVRRSTQPRTIRVLPTPKAETPGESSTASTPPPHVPAQPPSAGGKLPSRRPSIASINAPGTPSSDKAPDNASVTTDSISRAGSPNRGPAEHMAQVKSRGYPKKERNTKSKASAEGKKSADKEILQLDEGPAHEPVVGRIKKTKKQAAPITSTSTPEPSRPSSPAPAEAAVKTEAVEKAPELPQATVAAPAQAPIEAPREVAEPSHDPESDTKATKPSRPLPASTISQMEATGSIDPARLDFFRASSNLFNSRHDITSADLLNTQPPAQLTSSELETLDAGKPVRRVGDDNRSSSRLLITPSRKCLPRLTAEMEDRYMDLEKALADAKPPVKYIHKRKEAAQLLMTADDILKDMCATLTRPPTTTNAAANATATNGAAASGTSPPSPDSLSASAAAYGDDALAYLNQFILPPLPPRTATLPEPAVPPGAPIDAEHPATCSDNNPASATSTNLRTSRYLSGSGTGTPGRVSPSPGVLNSLGQDLSSLAAAAAAAAAGAGNEANILPSDNAASASGGGSPAAITEALANTVNGVVQAAAAAATGVSVGSLGQSSTAAAAAVANLAASRGGSTAAPGIAGIGGMERAAALGFMNMEDAEQALSAAKKEVEALEKKMAALVRRNRRLAGLH